MLWLMLNGSVSPIIYTLLFPLELFLSQLLFLSEFSVRTHFGRRIALVITGIMTYCLLMPKFLSNPWVAFLYFSLVFVLFVPVAQFLFNCSLSERLFCCSAGFCLQNMTINVFSIITFLLGACHPWALSLPGQGILRCLCFTAVYMTAYLLFIKGRMAGLYVSSSRKQALGFACLTLLFANFLNCFLTSRMGGGMQLIAAAIAVICCNVLNIYVQYSLFVRDALAREVREIEALLRANRHLYEKSREQRELISMKLHDLRYATRASLSDPELVELIEDYDASLNTGNEALDVILSESYMRCRSRGIRLSAIADGHLLDRMNSADTYAMIGNILDNAIESVQQLPPERRSISFYVTGTDGQAQLRVDNYMAQSPVFENGFPRSSKPSGELHGYGLKSVAYLVKKYGGEMTFQLANDIFSLMIQLPL